MKKNVNIWYVVRFKVNEFLKFERNLKNQNYKSYIPRFTKQLANRKVKTIALFPGYGFIRANTDDLNSLKYTRGLINILRSGDGYAYIDNKVIKSVKKLEKLSNINPISKNLKIGDEISIKSGPFKDYISKITSLPAKDRVVVLLSLLGSDKNIELPLNSIERM